MRKISTDLGSIYSSLDLKLDKFESSVTKALQGFYKLQTGTQQASSIMDKSVHESVNNIEKSYKIWNAANERTGKSIFDNSKQIESYRDRIKLLDSEINKSEKTLMDIENQLGKNSKEAEEYRAHVLDLKLSHSGLTEELKKAINETGTFAGRLELLGKEFDKIDKKYEVFDKVGDGLQSAGNKLTMKVTLPIVAAGTAVTKTAIDFESAFAGVRKTIDATEEQFEGLNKGIRDMTKIMPQTAVEISGVSEAAGQLGIQTKNVLGFTKTMVMLGDSTNMSSEQAATSLARLANITQMPQTEFDKLGSTIVALGNNLATTESDIVNMSLRLAGAGRQIGLTEAQIMSFSGALSSVGIEAEAGGSAFSKVMVDMQLAVETGNKDLKNFAKVAGMSSKEFQKAFKENASGALISFIEGLSKTKDSGESAIKVLDEMGISEVRMRDALLRASGAGDLFNKSIKLGTKAWEENVALTNEAAQRYETTESKLKIMKNQLVDAGISMGKNLLPHVVTVSKNIGELADKFRDLSPTTQEWIVKIGLASATLGPFLSITGGVTKGVGSLLKLGPKVSTFFGLFQGATVAANATSAVGTATTVATGSATGGGILGLGAALGKTIAVSAPWVAGAAAVAGTGYLIYKGMTEDAIPAVDLFLNKMETTTKTIKNSEGEITKAYEQTTAKISEETKKAVGAYMELDEKATASLINLYTSTSVITKENADVLISTYSNMTSQINAGLDKSHIERLNSLRDFFANSTALSEKEETDILTRQNNHNEEMKASNEEYHRKIKEILERAIAEKRTLRQDEVKEIEMYQDNMRENAVKSLSKEEVETKIIMERLKAFKGRITAEQASEVIANAEKQRLEAVAKAEQQYNQTVAEIIRMRDETGVITAEQADKLIQEAERQRDQSVHIADLMKKGVVNKVKEMNGDILKDINETDGSIKDRWDKLKEWFNNNPIIRMIKTVGGMGELAGANNTIGENWTGTNNWRGGLTTLHERGYELYDLPQSTRIYNHQASEALVKETAKQVAESVLANSQQGIKQEIKIYSPDPLSPSEIARQVKNASRQLALDW